MADCGLLSKVARFLAAQISFKAMLRSTCARAVEHLSPEGKPCLNKIVGGERASVVEKNLLIRAKTHSQT